MMMMKKFGARFAVSCFGEIEPHEPDGSMKGWPRADPLPIHEDFVAAACVTALRIVVDNDAVSPAITENLAAPYSRAVDGKPIDREGETGAIARRVSGRARLREAEAALSDERPFCRRVHRIECLENDLIKPITYEID